MSSARGRALSEQRRHPIHRAKKPWTNTKRPASNQPQNKRGEPQAIANDINSKPCRDQHSTLRAMPKFPNGSLHKNKPSMNTIHVSIHTRNDPPKPSHKKLTRLGRDIHVAWTTRTRPSNMVKTANVMTTRPNTSVSNIKILGTVQRSRRKRTPCRQSTRLRPRSRKLPNTIPINSVKQTVFKAIKIIVPPSGLTMFVETPSAPSSTDHMLTSTGIINDSKIKNRTRQSITPFPVSVTNQRWDVALSKSVASNRNSTAITTEKHCMKAACRNLGVYRSLIQRWDVALSVFIASDGNCTAITSEKCCVK